MHQDKHNSISEEKMGKNPSHGEVATFSFRRLYPARLQQRLHLMEKPPSLLLSMMLCGTEHHFVKLRSAVLTMSGPSFLSTTSLLTGWQSKDQTKIWCYFSHKFRLQHLEPQAAAKEVNSISAGPNTQLWLFFGRSDTCLFLHVFRPIA